MPRRPSYGRPGSRPIPATWTTDMGAVMTRTLDCTVSIGPAQASQTWDDDQGRTVITPADTVYTGPASIAGASLSGDGGTLSGAATADENTEVDRLEVALPHDDTSPIAIDHVVTVITSPEPALIGARLTVTGFERADRAFTRVLFATLNV